MNTKRSYCKRIFVLLMAFMIVFTMMPSGMFGSVDTAWADTTLPTEISTAEQFAAMSANGNYKLANDITVSAPYNGTFSGTFDGDGYTVEANFSISAYDNVGLFKKTGGGAVIKNLSVKANIASSIASSSYGTGGIVGQVYGETTLMNCGVTGEIRNTASSTSSPVYVGGLVGYQQDKLILQNCFNAASVISNAGSDSTSTGGLIGKGGSYAVEAENCYNIGTISANKGYAGGIVGYGTASSAKKHIYKNCYTAGKVNAGKAYGFVYNSYAAYCSIDNCYYDAANENGFNGTSESLHAKSAEELKAIAADLGDAFQDDTTNLNSGYPILSWQYIDPNATCTVSFEITPADSILTWNGDEQTVSENGTYIFDGVKVGEYTYNIANEAGDYTTQSGRISAKGKAISKKINLELNRHNLAFTLVPSDAELTVKKGEDILEAVSGNTYSVVNGTYAYEASSFGYKTKIGTVEVNRSDKTETISLQEQPITTVSFDFGDVNDISGGKIAVAAESGINMTAKENTDGKVFELPAGYKYSYSFTSGNYAKQSGIIDLTAVTEVQNETITLTMVPKTAWEGADDITEPVKDAEGAYQISGGSELAWLASQINSGKNNTCSAVLTKDIDLGNESWTAIGKNSAYSFKGKFDGQGHTVKNLNISGTSSANYGLFGYVDGGTIKNLTVEGEINISGSGSGSYGVGGITGTLYGTAGNIENCVNKVTVNGSQNVGGIAGYVSGGYSSANKQIKNCVNLGKISSNSYNAGGIVGYAAGQVTIDSCYNRGECISGSYRAGGIAAYMYSSYAKVQNCYSAASVSVKSGSDAKSIVGNKSSGTITNCFYLDTAPADTNATAKTSDELKALAATLGESFVTAPSNMNDGYPMLSFQIPTYELSFNVNDETATVEIEGQSGVHSGSTWTFKLPDGSYSYEVYAYGKISQNGVIEVKGAQVTQEIRLVTADTKEISFKVTPAEASAAVSVFFRGTAVDTETAGKYTLPYGSYTYQVKAKGYTKATGTLIVDENSDAQITVNLIQTSAWDGETKTQASGNGTQTSPYLIEDGEMLAWFADLVNKASTSTELYAELTDKIDLGNNPWTPIGKDFHEFQGSFDGKGYAVSGLNVSGVADAGLFGVIKNAEIKNLTVSGSAIGTENAGGIAGEVKTTACSFTNCGNDAAVSGKIAGGIVGNNSTYGVECTFTNCYNAGNITATERAGGIIARNNGSNSNLKVSGCYNIGTITSDEYAGGILGGTGLTVSDSYNSGKVSGSDATKTGAFSTGKSDVVTNCYYLGGSANDNSGKATAVSAFELQKLALSDEFEHVSGINRDYPVLKWQGLKANGGNATLAEDAEFIFEKVPLSVFSEGEEATNMLASTKLTWKAVSGAEKYVITLWKQSFTDEGALEISFAAAITDVTATPDADDESKLVYDCKAAFDELEEGVYYAALVPMNADGSYIAPTQEQLEDEVIGWVSPYDRLKKVTNLRWDDGRAYWDAKANFTEEDIYTINLYTVTYEDGAASGEPTYEFFRSYELEGNYSASDFRNIFAAETNYAFTIIAQTSQNYQVRYGLTDSPVSDMSPVYMAGTIDVPTEDHEDWIAISTAKQWVDLANVEDVPSVDGDSSSPSMQAVEWSKNYYLTADIDFSKLSAAD